MAPIAVKQPTEPETEEEHVEKLMLRGLEQGLQSEIAHRFNTLCSGSATDIMGSLNRFSNGVALTRRVYFDAKLVIEEESKQS
jgi:hypothetical protein